MTELSLALYYPSIAFIIMFGHLSLMVLGPERMNLIKRYQVGKLRFFGIPDGVTYRELD